MRGAGEELSGEWPKELGGGGPSGEGLSTLTEEGDRMGKDLQGLKGLYRDRIGVLNPLIQHFLIPTRRIVISLEILNSLWLVLLVIALSVDRGKQGVFSEGTEATLVVLIIINGIGVNAVRVRPFPHISLEGDRGGMLTRVVGS